MERQTDNVHIEMLPVTNGNDATAHANGQDSVDGAAARNVGEMDSLLQGSGSANGNAVVSNGEPDIEAPKVPDKKKNSAVLQIKKELREKVCKVVPMWLILVLIFLVVILIIFISLALCRVIYEDPDERYDPTQFDALRNVSGSFRLPNLNSTEELLNMTTSMSRALAAELESKLDEVYTNSSALGRYFMRSHIYQFSSVPVQAWFLLLFRMREEEGGQLSRYTLSRELLYNVLRQFLYEQEVGPSHHMYILPSSLNMSALSD
ncbi:unnamed protein product [Knipowitschia caucasica]